MNQFIPKVIFFDEILFDRNVRHYTPISRQCNKIVALYNALSIGDVTNSLFIDIERYGVANIRKAYTGFIEGEIARQGIKIKSIVALHIAAIDEDLQPITAEIVKLKELQSSLSNDIMNSYLTCLDLLDVVDGEVSLTDRGTELLRTHYSIFIDNQEQQEAWDGFLKIKAAWDEQHVISRAECITVS